MEYFTQSPAYQVLSTMEQEVFDKYFMPDDIVKIKAALNIINTKGICTKRTNLRCEDCFAEGYEKATCTPQLALNAAKYFLNKKHDQMIQGPCIHAITVEYNLVLDSKEEPKEALKTEKQLEMEMLIKVQKENADNLQKLLDHHVKVVNTLSAYTLSINVNNVNIRKIVPPKLAEKIEDYVNGMLQAYMEETHRNFKSIINYSSSASPESVMQVYGKLGATDDN